MWLLAWVHSMVNVFWMLVRALGRGRINSVVDSGPVQALQLQLSQSEIRDGTPRLAEYGFHSNPPPGSDAVLVCLGADRTHGVVIACGHQKYRMTGLETGEVALADDLGQTVYLTRTGIVIKGAGLPMLVTDTPKITLDTPLVKATGDVEVDGNVTVHKDLIVDQNVTATENITSTTGNIVADVGSITAVAGNIGATIGNIVAGGDIADQGGAKTLAGMRTVYNEHTHEVTSVENGPHTVTSNEPTPTE
jgi:phage baseplate assembly protein V